jgi:RNA polymerase sigma-70 factor (ECF subfamily)
MGIKQLLRWRDRSRFDDMVDQHHSAIYSYACWLTRCPARAEDLVQEVYVRAWKHLDQLEQEVCGRSWLITILRREHLRWLEKRSNGHDEMALDEEIAQDERYSDPYCADTELQRHQLQKAMLKLESGYLEPLLMQVLGGYSIGEIAESLALTESAVQSRLYRARLQLGQLLNQKEASTTPQRGAI